MSGITTQSAGVRSQHKDYTSMHARWTLCRDAAEGEHAIHSRKEAYLPRLKGEEDEAYKSRLKMTPFFNATWRTIAGMRGLLFRKPPMKDVPAAADEAMEDIDLAGTTMDSFAHEIAKEALTVGRVCVLADHPTLPEGTTLADKKQMGARAFLVMYKAESFYNWKEDRINGVTKLVQVRLKEEAELPGDDEFNSGCEERYRVLDLVNNQYRQRLFRIDKNGKDEQIGEDLFPKINNKTLDYIPFVVIGVDSVGPCVETPPLIDLVTTNFHHYLQATSYERGCFFSGLPTLFISGMDTPGPEDTPISIGGNLANILPDPNAKAYYVEMKGDLTALRTNLEDKKKEMAVLGARMLEGGKSGGQVEAAETVARRQSGEESVLSAMAQTISQGLERALEYMFAFENIVGYPEYQINRDFIPTSMTAQELSALVKAWQDGGISKQVLFENLKKGEIIEDTTTFEDEEARIADEGMKFAAQQSSLNPLSSPTDLNGDPNQKPDPEDTTS